MPPDMSQRQGHRVFQTACRDYLRRITSETLERRFWRRSHGVSEEYRLHKNFNFSAGRLWDLRVKQQ
jgi:hypothetical protein